jgi:lipoate-protein ligase A
MKRNTWSLIDTGPSDAYTNMAIDEVLLERMRSDEALPILRFYTWSRPAISVGYFQNVIDDFDLRLCQKRGWALVRRLTGGRAVFHDHELTYSILVPPSFTDWSGDILSSYRYFSQGLLLGLRKLGADAELVSLHGSKKSRRSEASRSPDCFASPSWYEISVDGKKIVGSAQRRMPYGILQQGSIMISTRRFQEFREVFRQSSDKMGREENRHGKPGITSLTEVLDQEIAPGQLKQAIIEGFEKAQEVRFIESGLSRNEQKKAEILISARYGNDDWNLRRKPSVLKEKSRN